MRLVDADEMIVRANCGDLHMYDMYDLHEFLTHIQTVDTVKVRYGEWVRRDDDDDDVYWYECSVCHNNPPCNDYGHEYHSLYCPSCGAKMYKEVNDE